jgi:hypothetical protein
MRKFFFVAVLVCFASGVTQAGVIEFTAGSTASVTFSSTGALSGSIDITSVTGIYDTPPHNGSTLAITAGTLAFSFTGTTSDGSGGYFYTGGTFMILGQLPSGSLETLLSGTLYDDDPADPGFNPISRQGSSDLYEFSEGNVSYNGTVSSDLASYFGFLSTATSGAFGLSFTQSTPVGPTSLVSGNVTALFTVQEPRSAIMCLLAIVGGLGWKRFRL